MSEQQGVFDQVLRGYDREQVDAALAELRSSLTEAQREREASVLSTEARLQHLAEDLDAAIARADRAEARMLRLVQQVQTLDDDSDDAVAERERIRSDA